MNANNEQIRNEALERIFQKINVGETDDVRRLLEEDTSAFGADEVALLLNLSDLLDRLPHKDDLRIFSRFFNSPIFGELIDELKVLFAPDFEDFRFTDSVFAYAEHSLTKSVDGSKLIYKVDEPFNPRHSYKVSKSAETYFKNLSKYLRALIQTKIRNNGLYRSSDKARNGLHIAHGLLREKAVLIDKLLTSEFNKNKKSQVQFPPKMGLLNTQMGRYQVIADWFTWRVKLDVTTPDGLTTDFVPFAAHDVKMMIVGRTREKK